MFQEDNLHPHSLSTYLVDPPLPRSVTLDSVPTIYGNVPADIPLSASGVPILSPYIHQHREPLPNMTESLATLQEQQDVMALYSVVNKRPMSIQECQQQQQQQQQQQEQQQQQGDNYEDTESEYAVELRRQAYIQSIGKEGIKAVYVACTFTYCRWWLHG